MTQTFSTHVGFAEYQGDDHIYDGNCFPTCEGPLEKVVGYLANAIKQVEWRKEDDLSWKGQNGIWYSGSKAVARLEREIKSIVDVASDFTDLTEEEK